MAFLLSGSVLFILAVSLSIAILAASCIDDACQADRQVGVDIICHKFKLAETKSSV